jgi:putative transcriptional regulator
VRYLGVQGTLMESVRQGGKILRGEARPSRTFEVRDPDVAAVRERCGLSRQEFAALMGLSTRTLQNWEQGRRKPHGTARVLLRVAAEHPTRCGTRSRRLANPHRIAELIRGTALVR